MRSIFPIIMFLGCFVPITPTVAEIRALIIGVSDYEDETGITDLRGPRNDVRLMRDVLEKRSATDITLLADGVVDAEAPTHRAIADALAALASRAKTGDLVYIHLSGHGTRQIDEGGDETDGLDEVFLPADTQKAPPGSGQIPNALTDDEIGEAVRAIRIKGADVWLVMDSCHSGSGLRAAVGTIAVRNVESDTLGIDILNAKSASFGTPVDNLETTDGMGGYLAFYATRSDDVAREVDLSKGEDASGNQWYGLFTSTLAAKLESTGALTYRQAYQSVLSTLNHGGGLGAAGIQTPIWEGDLIDKPVFGGSASGGVQRYLLNGDELNAGLIHGLPAGTLLGLVADVTDPLEAVIGYAQIEEAEARQAYLRPVAEDCIPDAAKLCPVAEQIPDSARAAQLELLPKDRIVRFSLVLSWQNGETLSDDDQVQISVADALDAAAAKLGITIERSAERYDVQIALQDEKLWFGPQTQIGAEPVGLSLALGSNDEAEKLQAHFIRILKAELFAQTLDSLDGTGSFLNPSPVEIGASRFSSRLSDLTRPDEALDIRKECRRALSKSKPSGFATLDDGADMKQCDLLRFSAQGTRDGQRDVNRIHIDAHYCIHVAYELVEGISRARQVGSPMVMCSDCPGPEPYSAGHERLYFLISKARENQEALNLTGLVENCAGTERNADAKRSAQKNDLENTLEKLTERGATRGDMSGGFGLSDVWMDSYRWRVLPRREAFAREASE